MHPTMVTVKVETRSRTSCDTCYSASGTLVYDGAHIITCYHVFECESNETIKRTSFHALFAANFDAKKNRRCSLVKFDEKLDLAILKIKKVPDGNFDVASFCERHLLWDKKSTAPASLSLSYEHGIIANIDAFRGDDVITSSASPEDIRVLTMCGMVGREGSSGSSLLNKWGEILGISIESNVTDFEGPSGEIQFVGNIIISPSYNQLMDFVNSFQV